LDFEYPTASDDEDVKWYRVAGGTYQVIEAMKQRIFREPTLGARVTSIAYQSQDPCEPMRIQIDSEAQPRNYSAVFNTTSLPCMRRMTMGLGTLQPGQRVAIESVHYDASTKVAVKFKSAWWARYCQIYGGYASTDLPIRRCVYTSPDSDSDEPSRILLCSYTWGQDAQQMASLIGDGTKRSDLAQLLCHNLALIHQGYVDPLTEIAFEYSRMLDIIKEEFEEYHAYDWYSDPCTSGAFAYFGPEQFRHFYPELVRPAANGHMFLVGEACSAHHAWISGSLDSAYRGLIQYLHKLIMEGRVAPYVLDRLQTSWGTLDEIPGEVLEWQMYLAQISTN
jgi:monoamine oxidase